MTPTRSARLRSSRALGTALLIAAGLAAAIAGRGSAASAEPSATSAPGGFGNIEAWLDAPFPADLAAGTTLPVGVTLWDTDSGQLSTMNGLYLRLHPAKGKARPTEAETRSDWPGHILANVIVPKGGPGAIEVGISGRSCTADGACRDVDFPFQVGGIGPPPDAPRSLLINVRLQPLVQPVIAGRPLEIVIDLAPRAAWEPGSIGLPDRLVVLAGSGTGPDLASAEIHRGAGPVDVYRGQITVPEPGDIALMFALPGGRSGADDVIESATTRIKVAPAPDSAPAAAVADPAEGDVPWPLIGGAAALALLASLVIRRVFADL
jgi:hypothetical protein